MVRWSSVSGSSHGFGGSPGISGPGESVHSTGWGWSHGSSRKVDQMGLKGPLVDKSATWVCQINHIGKVWSRQQVVSLSNLVRRVCGSCGSSRKVGQVGHMSW
jgi:hypothetical protein